MTFDPSVNMTTHDIVGLVMGTTCPCGHASKDHAAPSGKIPGEKTGDCSKCGCKGVIDISDDEEFE